MKFKYKNYTLKLNFFEDYFTVDVWVKDPYLGVASAKIYDLTDVKHYYPVRAVDFFNEFKEFVAGLGKEKRV